MAWTKTFRINPLHGVPDKDIREFLNLCEKEAFINVSTAFIPAIGLPGQPPADPRLTVIVTKLDNLHDDDVEVDTTPRSLSTRN
jgi:hypothetical protein